MNLSTSSIKMESEVLHPPYLQQFMLSPLVTWVKTFGPIDAAKHFDYAELLDGVFLNQIMMEINPEASLQSVHNVNLDSSRRVQNLTVLISQIKTYYLENLKQLLLMAPPNMLVLGKWPHSKQGLEEMNKLLLLLLGCAVQCERKEEYIEQIQTLDFDTQAAIAVHIREVTHSEQSVFDLHWLESNDLNPEELLTASRNLALNLRRVVEQRDTQLETIVDLVQEKESRSPSPPSAHSPGEYPSMQQQQAGAHQHLAVELADSRSRIRRLQLELEEKSEQVQDGRLELENLEAELKRLQKENSSLLPEARAARTYRDELDALRERAILADKLESEVARYREKLHSMEFYKTKVEDLKEDNQVLLETKAVLEEQLENWRARSDKLHQLEKHSLLLKAHVNELEQEGEVQRRRLEELQEENLALCLAQRRTMDESQQLGWELEQRSKSPDNTEGQKSLSEEVNERTSSRLLKLEKENQSLLNTIEEMSRRLQHDQDRTSLYGDLLLVRKHNMCDVDIKDEIDLKELGGSGDVKEKGGSGDVKENGSSGDVKENGSSGDQEEEINGPDEDTLKDGMDLQEQEKGQLEEEGDLKDLTPDPEALAKGSPQQSPPSSKSPLRDDFAARSPYHAKRTERLEVRCRALDTENQRLQAALDNTGRKLQHMEAEVQELEAENQALQAGVEELKISSRRLEQVEQEKHGLEQEASALERDKRRLEKENRRLKQQAEIQNATLDVANMRVASLERDTRAQGKELDGLRETAERVKGLEGDNRELAKQAAIDQRTLATLREELVTEKLKSQQKENELERQAHELEMRVLNEDSPQTEEDLPENSRFKMLESELESSLKRSLQIKEDKMAALEARLQESSTLNQQLRQELKTVRLNYEALQQREEEGRSAACSPRESNRAVSEWQRESQEATRELLRVKDRLIEVERNNATLQAERQALQAQLRQLEAQSDGLQAQILALHRQTASLQENNTTLQTHNANLQVEKSTLNSQSASLLAQNAQLQRQHTAAEGERETTAREREELRGVHSQLLRDHERLAALQECLGQEYETLKGKHGGLKSDHRSLELEHRTLSDRYNTLLQQRSRLDGLETALREEQDKMAVEKDEHRATASRCRRLRDEKDWLNQTYRQLLKDNEELQADHRNLKSLLNSAKLDQTRLESDYSNLREQYQQLDITSTKLTNQCELLGQLKGNLEEENRHLLEQIQTLMLQNRTLLEQTMESKDLFHVEQRQYIDKLNDLRRQKEKLEEKIMDQYKFYEPSPPRRQNWFASKMKKLIKPRSRDSPGSLTLTHSGSTEILGGPHPSSCQDNASFVGSEGSGGSASTSMADALSPRHRSNKDSSDSAAPSGLEDNDELQNPALNGAGSRAQSESSGEFSLSLDNEPWSNGSSPVQRPPSRRCSSTSYQPPSDTSTPRHGRLPLHRHMQTSTSTPPHKEKVSKSCSSPVAIANDMQKEAGLRDAWPCRRSVIRRGSGGKDGRRRSSDSSAAKATRGPSDATAAAVRSSGCSPIRVLYVQGKSSSVSGCLNCFSAPLGKEVRLRAPCSPLPALPRASSVISTAEGSSRRPSVTLDCRAAATAVKVNVLPANEIKEVEDQGEDSANRGKRDDDAGRGASEPVPPVKPPRDPAVAATDSGLKLPGGDSLFGTPFNFNTVFSDTIFSESVVLSHGQNGKKNGTFVCLNHSLVRNISGLPLRPEAGEGIAPIALTEDLTETAPSQNGRHDQSRNGQHDSRDENTVSRVGEEVTVRTSDDKQFVIA